MLWKGNIRHAEQRPLKTGFDGSYSTGVWTFVTWLHIRYNLHENKIPSNQLLCEAAVASQSLRGTIQGRLWMPSPLLCIVSDRRGEWTERLRMASTVPLWMRLHTYSNSPLMWINGKIWIKHRLCDGSFCYLKHIMNVSKQRLIHLRPFNCTDEMPTGWSRVIRAVRRRLCGSWECWLSTGSVEELDVHSPCLQYYVNMVWLPLSLGLLPSARSPKRQSASLAVTQHAINRTAQMNAHTRCPLLTSPLPPSSAQRALRGQGRLHCISISVSSARISFLLADFSSCYISGWCPVPRQKCPGVHSGLRNSGKPRGAVGRLWPHKTSSSVPGGFECRSHSRTNVISSQKNKNVTAAALSDRWADEHIHLSSWHQNITFISYSWVD